ncbi:hypothetical protein QBC34DRAFT_41324 [Podospora aff. communis PSN243]|uniref:Uncharacterized protein n=1 Tax=Podospora aff. communis PSN243 TaxID=3040156 RepID=A0AAV9GTD2_9PEZI|nr:hypothetical protein QBC34DRAFT_41324 [Podospora aff. communis PSN243]
MPSLTFTPPEPTTVSARRSAPSLSTTSSPAPPRAATLRRKPSAGILTTSTTPSGGRTTRITTTTPKAASTSAPRLTPTTDRHPLRNRDQNVAATRQPLKPGLGSRLAPIITNRMPFDKPPSASTRPPTMPTVARGVNKTPLTPKVATRPPTAQHQNPPIATPLARRGPRSDLVLNSHGSVQREREELASPASGLLSNNITPRSGLRQLRVDSPSSTPAGTPTLERHDSWESRSALGIAASTIDDGPRRPTVTFETPTNVRQDPDSKFFYASDAPKPAQQPTLAKPVTAQQKPATFFYANGDTVPSLGNASNPQSAPVLASPLVPQDTASKFVYANGIPDLPVSSPRAGPSQPNTASSVGSTTSRIPTSRPTTAAPQTPYSPRPSSPVKLSPFPATKPTTNSTSPLTRSPGGATNTIGNQSFQRSGRPPGAGHARTRSLTSNLTIAEPPAVARIMSVHGSLPIPENSAHPSNDLAPPFIALPTSPTRSGFASLLQAAEEFAEEDEAQPESLNSPAKSPSQEKQLTDLVASARRERKVQDLEITNASLEAINRTLERQLRKQTAEIRRYRRLSRSGRLSLTSAGSRVASDATVDGGALARAGMGLDDLSEEESEIEAQEDTEDEDDDYSGSESSGDLNCSTMKLRDARHRQKDERRLQLDLSKHQQLLIDSQKINQSLKRCLGWTEELIKEGKRALEYKVRVSEVEIGGRVLAPEDIEAREAREARENEELAREDEDDGEDDEDSTLNVTSWGKDPQDRDSGIELPADGG